MKKILAVSVMCILIFGCFDIFAQTRTTSRTTGRTSRSNNNNDNNDNYNNRTSNNVDFVVAVIAGMLRHPKKEIRMQALQSLVAGMTMGSTDNNDNNNSNSSIGDIFALKGGSNNNDDDNNDNEGLGTTMFIPELFTMLADPDPQIRDLVSISLDNLFGTDTSLLRFMSDPDPVVRKYAVRLFVIRNQMEPEQGTGKSGSSDNKNNIRSSKDILIMRILLNMTKDPDPDIKKIATDALEGFMTNLEKQLQATMGTPQDQMPGGAQPRR
ncbi:MAG TPA: hypothetical protein PLS78_00955 [bacterium]|nr:hypothetical protein [bacterium]